MSLGNATFGGFIIGRESCLPTNDFPTQARRPRYIQKSQSKLLLVLLGRRGDSPTRCDTGTWDLVALLHGLRCD